MKWWDQMPWFDFFECWVLSQLFHSPLSPSPRGSLISPHFLPLRRCHFYSWGYWHFSSSLGTPFDLYSWGHRPLSSSLGSPASLLFIRHCIWSYSWGYWHFSSSLGTAFDLYSWGHRPLSSSLGSLASLLFTRVTGLSRLHQAPHWALGASLVDQWRLTHLPEQETQETPVWSLGWKDPLGEEAATCSSSCLENPTGRGAWWATGHGGRKSQTQLSPSTDDVLCGDVRLPCWFPRAGALCTVH